MTKDKYDAILCDLGNVLINFDHRIAVKKILPCTLKNEQEVYQLFFDSALTKEYEEGKISSIEFFKGVKNLVGLDMGYNEFLPIWDNIFFSTELRTTNLNATGSNGTDVNRSDSLITMVILPSE